LLILSGPDSTDYLYDPFGLKIAHLSISISLLLFGLIEL
jgi:hypothetical protein